MDLSLLCYKMHSVMTSFILHEFFSHRHKHHQNSRQVDLHGIGLHTFFKTVYSNLSFTVKPRTTQKCATFLQ